MKIDYKNFDTTHLIVSIKSYELKIMELEKGIEQVEEENNKGIALYKNEIREIKKELIKRECEEDFKPCPFCGSRKLSLGYFEYSKEGNATCICGASIGVSDLPFNETLTVFEKEQLTTKILKQLWNRRSREEDSINEKS